jgi:hypothetical protein
MLCPAHILGSAEPTPQALLLDNDYPAPNMDIVNITVKLGSGGRRREGSANARTLAPTPPLRRLAGTYDFLNR